MNERLEAAWARAGQVVGRRVGGSYVLVPLVGRGADLDAILTLNPVAAFIWEELEGVRTGEALVQAVVARFDVDRARAERDTLELLDALVSRKAVVPAAPSDRH